MPLNKELIEMYYQPHAWEHIWTAALRALVSHVSLAALTHVSRRAATDASLEGAAAATYNVMDSSQFR